MIKQTSYMSRIDQLEDILDVVADHPGLDVDNYTYEEVYELNEWGIDMAVNLETTLPEIIKYIYWLEKENEMLEEMNERLCEQNTEVDKACAELEEELNCVKLQRS